MTTQKVKVNKEWIKIANENAEDETENERPKDERESIPEFTKQELQTAIDCLQKGKSGDNKGIKAEDIKGCEISSMK